MTQDRPGGDGPRDETPGDAAWEQIVASLRGPDSEGGTGWPLAEDVDASEPDSPEQEQATTSDGPVVIWRGSDADVDAEINRAVPDEHFEPPEPPPLPRADAITWAAWLGVIGSPLVLLLMTALGVTSQLLVVAVVAAFLGGVGVLITRLRTHRDPFDPDDGAVV